MPLIRGTNVFYKGDYPVTLLPPPRRLAPSLGLGTTWVRQLRSGSCHHPTAATNVTNSRAKPQQTPSVEKHAHPPRVVYCAIYLTLTLITKFRVSNLHISTRYYAANTWHQRILQGRLSRYTCHTDLPNGAYFEIVIFSRIIRVCCHF